MTGWRRRFARACVAFAAAVLVLTLFGPGARAQTGTETSCFPVAQRLVPGIQRVAFQRTQATGLPRLPAGTVQLTYLGQSSFLLRTPADVTAITDYNGMNRAPFAPDIVTMNHAHSSHYTDFVEPGVKHILRGWATPPEGYPRHDLRLKDLRVRNVATNIRDGAGGTELAGNSIFIFETQGLCISHFGHLHHHLDADRLGRMGQIDVAMVPVDGSMTLPPDDMAAAVAALNPRMVVPMHVFGPGSLNHFLTLMEKRGYRLRRTGGPDAIITRNELRRRSVLVFPDELF
jgi:L-ascorbate metabolism protein UlaG (beta-lactamase superfamily)